MRFKSLTSYLVALLTYILLALGLSSPAFADPFTWRDDPFSGLLSGGVRSDAGNTVTFSNLQVISTEATPDLAVILPWFFPVFRNGTPEATTYSMEWSNAANGWVNDNVEGTSLLVTLDNILGRLLFGSVADVTGTAPLDPTRILNGVSETRLPGDLVPFLDLGAFAANEIKSFDLVLTYHFGDGRALPAGTGAFGALNTISQIPEPPMLALLGIALLGLGLSRSPRELSKQIS